LDKSEIKVLAPVLRLQCNYQDALNDMVKLAKSLGLRKNIAVNAWVNACNIQLEFERELKKYGRDAVNELDNRKNTFGIVLFGRPYNAFTGDTNMGIPHKVTTKGHLIIPFDMLPYENSKLNMNMYWAMGQKILLAADYLKKKNNLFGFYITNFSCGPDSFLISYFRNKMGDKPSLTLELDQHTADAGIDTRIEAALDIMSNYYQNDRILEANAEVFFPAKLVLGSDSYVIASDGNKFSLSDPKVELLIPPLSAFSAEANAAVFRSAGINARMIPVSDNNTLLCGRKNSSCKECLPYILTTGMFLNYIENEKDPDKITLFLMGAANGPCRFGQYSISFEEIIKRKRIPNAALFTINDNDNVFKIFGGKFLLSAWKGIVIADVFSDIKSMLAVTAENIPEARVILDKCWQNIVYSLEDGSKSLTAVLSATTSELRGIELKKVPRDVPVITLVGEIYVRGDEFSRKWLIDYLEKHGFAVFVAPIGEYANYSCYVAKKGYDKKLPLPKRIALSIALYIQDSIEKKIKNIFVKSNLYDYKLNDLNKTIKSAKHLIDERLLGEAILTVGLAMHEILERSCGVISIGPFGCMPSRLSEAILKKEMHIDGIRRMNKHGAESIPCNDFEDLPYLAIETDGSPFSQQLEANLEAFILRAKRIQDKIKIQKRAQTVKS
jgi:predicted nucleotide-binding protein (sugar kinase/HSP70/actin superfamily)